MRSQTCFAILVLVIIACNKRKSPAERIIAATSAIDSSGRKVNLAAYDRAHGYGDFDYDLMLPYLRFGSPGIEIRYRREKASHDGTLIRLLYSAERGWQADAGIFWLYRECYPTQDRPNGRFWVGRRIRTNIQQEDPEQLINELLDDSLLQLPDYYERTQAATTSSEFADLLTLEIACGRYYKYCAFSMDSMFEAGRYRQHAQRIVRRLEQAFFRYESMPSPADTMGIKDVLLPILEERTPPIRMQKEGKPGQRQQGS